MKKLNKFFAVLVALAMMATLCVSMAFAEGTNNPATNNADSTSVKTPMAKAINKAEGTANPTVNTFYFTVENIEGPDAETKSAPVKNETLSITVPVDKVAVNAEDALAGFTFNKTGIYKFKVTENAPVKKNAEGAGQYDDVNGRVGINETTKDNFKTTETTKYSEAEYEVYAVVASVTNDAGVETKYIQSVTVKQIKDDAGKTLETEAKPDVTTDPETNKFKFTNTFNKKIENTKPDETTETQDKNTLIIKKTHSVDAEAPEGTAVTDIPDQEFNFYAKVKFPAQSETLKYTAVVKDSTTNKPVADKAEVVFERANTETTEVAKTFKLKAGQYLEFTAIDSGAKVIELKEDSYPGFKPSGTIAATDEGKLVKDEGDNAINVDNAYNPSNGSVTGILMSNIPYIILALVAIGGLCAYVVVRRKNADEA